MPAAWSVLMGGILPNRREQVLEVTPAPVSQQGPRVGTGSSAVTATTEGGRSLSHMIFPRRKSI